MKISLNEYFTEWILHWMSTSLNEYFTEWVLHWMSTSLNEYFTEWVLEWMSTSLNEDFTEWILHWKSTSLNEYFTKWKLHWVSTCQAICSEIRKNTTPYPFLKAGKCFNWKTLFFIKRAKVSSFLKNLLQLNVISRLFNLNA